MASQAEAKSIESASDAAIKSSVTTITINLLVTLLMSGSLSQIWAMIEGLQTTVVLPLFDAKTPGNVQTFLDGLN